MSPAPTGTIAFQIVPVGAARIRVGVDLSRVVSSWCGLESCGVEFAEASRTPESNKTHIPLHVCRCIKAGPILLSFICDLVLPDPPKQTGTVLAYLPFFVYKIWGAFWTKIASPSDERVRPKLVPRKVTSDMLKSRHT